MARKLLIVESPAKARTIGKILGRDFVVKASVGHVRDLPKSSLGIDEDSDFEPQYEVLPDKQKVVAELQKAAKSADEVFVATDPDREGEAICWHITELLKTEDKPISRVEFHEITKRAVLEAFSSPREVDIDRVNAQQARRIVDRIMGYRLSPLLWDKVKRGLSAGRVQSVALKMICDRESAIAAFDPEEYWLVDAEVGGAEPPVFSLRLTRRQQKKWRPTNESEAKAAETAANNGPLTITKLAKKKSTQRPRSPFITSHLQQEAARRMSLPVRRTMQLAQRLYEGVDLGGRGTFGLITYMRTDSVRVSPESVEQARELIVERFGQDALPDKPHAFKNKSSAQDAHEAIRPTDVSLTPDSLKEHLDSDALRLYRLIWERFVASQMASAVFDVTQVEATAGDYGFTVTGKVLKKAGFLQLWKEPEDGNGDQQKDTGRLPTGLAEGQVLDCRSINLEQKFTQPPPRFSEASLVKALEENGIGRPSTYASIINTLSSRDYTVREKGAFHPTELGKLVARLLVASFTSIINEKYTAGLEEGLDRIAEGQGTWQSFVTTFAGRFYKDLELAREEMEQVKGKGIPTDESCPECSLPLVLKFGKYGEFFACSGYPECRHTRDPNQDKQAEAVEGEAPSCPECEAEMVQRRSRFGPFWACSRYPECRGTKRIGGGTGASSPPRPTGVGCPADGCDGEIVERKSRRGRIFFGCSRYPKCDYSMWDPPLSMSCEECNHPVVGLKETKRRGRELACPVKDCGHRAPAPDDLVLPKPPPTESESEAKAPSSGETAG